MRDLQNFPFRCFPSFAFAFLTLNAVSVNATKVTQKRDDEGGLSTVMIRYAACTFLQISNDPVSNSMFRNAVDYEKLYIEEAERKIPLYKY